MPQILEGVAFSISMKGVTRKAKGFPHYAAAKPQTNEAGSIIIIKEPNSLARRLPGRVAGRLSDGSGK